MKWVGVGLGLNMLPFNLLSPLLKSKTKCILRFFKKHHNQNHLQLSLKCICSMGLYCFIWVYHYHFFCHFELPWQHLSFLFKGLVLFAKALMERARFMNIQAISLVKPCALRWLLFADMWWAWISLVGILCFITYLLLNIITGIYHSILYFDLFLF